MARELYELGQIPPLGETPSHMRAALIRRERYGPPDQAIQIETVEVPEVRPGQVLVMVMAAGINYNGVWAGLGAPADVIADRAKKGDPYDFHIAGSEGSGVVWAVGEGVREFRVGDPVIIGGITYDESAPDVRMGVDPTTSRSQRAWGYEVNFGSFAQFTAVEEYQCYHKPPGLTWEQAGSFILTTATAYRQLLGWHPHTVQPGDPVLIWGGSGGLGSMAIQITRFFGGVPVAVVSDDSKIDYCMGLGAHGVINRRDFDHWGRMPDADDAVRFRTWQAGTRAFNQKIWEVLGGRRAPRIVLEHPGTDTLPTSVQVCDRAGMVVTCGGTSGFNGDFDLRFLWMFQKRLQGSHAANRKQAAAVVDLVGQGHLDTCTNLSLPFEEIAHAHQLVYESRQPPGNVAVLVNAPEPGLTDLP